MSVAFRHIAATRNAGAAAASGGRLCFVDADTLIDARVLRAAIAALDAGDVGGGCAVVLDGEPPFGVRTFTAALMHVFRWMRVTPGSLYCRHPCEGRDPERGVVWRTCRCTYQRA